MRLIFLLLLLCAGCSTKPFEKYPGAYVWGQCAPYARAVVADLEEHHIEAFKIVYLWRSGVQQGAHAVVLYKATDGRWALVENTWCAPVYVKGNTLLAMMKSYDPLAVMISDWDMCPLPIEGKADVEKTTQELQHKTASWYWKSKRRDGLMSNGQRFNPDALTAASWFFPLGTRLKVVGPFGPVEVTVTDRGPHKRLLRTRQIDLSRRAFALICPLDAGLIEVTVEVLP